MTEHTDNDESLEFMYNAPDELNLKLETPVDKATVEKFCRPALKCLVTDGIDLNGLRGPSEARPHAVASVFGRRVMRVVTRGALSPLATLTRTFPDRTFLWTQTSTFHGEGHARDFRGR